MQETIRLFDRDSHRTSFQAAVLSAEPLSPDNLSLFPRFSEKYHADASSFGRWSCCVLDQTLFFPEGGGQMADRGILTPAGKDPDDPGCVHVCDVQEKDGVIYHLLDGFLPADAGVTGEIDWELRFDRMQQHSGEHIFSGLVHTLFGYDNVGFHLGETETTLDFSGPLTREQAQDIEHRVNRAIYENIPVHVLYPSKEELSSYSYRSKIEIEGQVRLVEFPGYDLCACCAPHVFHTGEIGVLKVVDVMSHRGGTRITILCGMRALRDYIRKDSEIRELSALLSAKETMIADSVRRLGRQVYDLRGQIMRMQEEQLDARLQSLAPESRDVCFILDDLSSDSVREFVNHLMERCDGFCAAFYGTEESGYQYIIGSRTNDLRPFCKEMNRALNGRGGGRPEMVQGRVQADRESIRAWMLSAKSE